MIKIDFKLPSKADMVRAATAEIEKQIAQKARDAAARNGGVTFRFTRKPDGGVRAVEFQGSERAIRAARDAIGG